MQYLPFAFFLLGFLLILTEVFVPGFGVFGLIGTICLAVGIYMVEDDFYMAMIEMALVMIGMAIILPILIKLINKRRVLRRFGLTQSLTTEEGFTSRKKGLDIYIGSRGEALSDLRPSGIMILDDDTRLDVLTRGDYIKAGDAIEVVKVDGTWLVVKKINIADKSL